MAVVAIRFSPLPAHVRTARLLASAIARRNGVAEQLLDEVRFAVGEACSRAVELHSRFAPDSPVRLEIADGSGRLQVDVVDTAPAGEDVAGPDEGSIGSGIFDPDAIATVPRQGGDVSNDPTVDFLPAGFGLAVIRGIVDDVEVLAVEGAGTRVRMSWALPGGFGALAQPPPQ